MNRRIFSLFIFLALIFLISLQAASKKQRDNAHKLTILYTTNRSGEVEPCGCCGKEGSFGGLAKQATYIDNLKKEGKNLLLLDSGDFLFSSSFIPGFKREQLSLKADLILEVYTLLGYDAIALGDSDLALGIDSLLEKTPSFPFVSANLVDKRTGSLLFQSYLIREINGLKVCIFGLIGDKFHLGLQSKHLAVEDPFKAARKVIEAVKPESELIIVLSHLGLQNNLLLAEKVPDIDIILDGHTRRALETPKIVGQTLILSSGKQGQYLGQLDLTIIKGAHERTENKGQTQLKKRYTNHLILLDTQIGKDEKIQEMIVRYKVNVAKLQARNSRGSSSPPKASASKVGFFFTGALTCQACHPKQYQFWQKTDHSKAYETLLRKRQEFDLECIGCHTTGYRLEGGYNQPVDVGNLKGVQCESCHGPGSLHQMSKHNISRIVKKETCIKCHTSEKSPKFHFTSSIKKVRCPD